MSSVLDACCGSRMMWFDAKDGRAVFVDKRSESHELPDVSSRCGARTLVISPDVVADFTALPFPDASFALVAFDPPHLVRNGKESWMGKKYGTLKGDWREELRRGFAECFRVLKPEGTLVFKWNETDIPVSQILALTPERPLFGNRCGKTAKSHWIVFLKSAAANFFIPLKAEHFEDFEAGRKREEFRPASSHFAKAKVGDTVTLSYGYGKRRRLSGRVVSVRFTRDLDGLKGWRECYGTRFDEAVCLGIVLDKSRPEAGAPGEKAE